MPIRKYPIGAIDEGIMSCLRNSKRILACANKLHDDGYQDFASLIYSFALEEFGKAVLLRKVKQEQATKKEYADTITFQDHAEKIKAAISELGNSWIAVPMFEEPEATSEIKVVDGKIVIEGQPVFQEMIQKGAFLSLENRLASLFVDYDQKSKEWKTWEKQEKPLAIAIGNALAAFARGIDEWAKSNGYQE